MSDTVQLQFKDGATISVEVTPAAEDLAPPTRGLDDVAERTVRSAESALSTLACLADSLQDGLARAVRPPDNVVVRFGIKFDSTAGMVLASGTVGATFDVTMEWRKADVS